ncbi:hypothetical protein PtA15_4A388 [Puccinia triticina]|uniref:Exocyst complex component EXO84 n=1 Tax=Puccinia triticina TaxID=208348 RepID=A0ABY7CHX0_9BASI|nr:uncharacterized protein PtA15_4A388 [Puccinia triticina]WAQ83938.1 hypothetical protein PtA15_4A388 [Puccinia triticina]
MASRKDAGNSYEALQSTRETLKLYELENKKLEASIRTSNAKLTKQSLLIRALYVQGLDRGVERIEEARESTPLQDPELLNFAGSNHRLHRALLPQLRSQLLEMADALEPTRFEEVRFSDDPETEITWLQEIASDACEILSSVFTQQRQASIEPRRQSRAYYTLHPYYYPQIVWTVDQILIGIVDLFVIHMISLQDEEPWPVESGQAALGNLLRLIDQMISDLQHPRRMVQAKWQRVVREIELMELAVIKCSKPKELRENINPEGIDGRIDLQWIEWVPREEMDQSQADVLESFLPVLKICRILLNKLSRPTSSEPLVLLEDDMDILNGTYAQTEQMEQTLRMFTIAVLKLRPREARKRMADSFANFGYLLQKNQSYLRACECDNPDDSALVQKALAWCQRWTVQYQTAASNFKKKLASCYDAEFPYYDDSGDETERVISHRRFFGMD